MSPASPEPSKKAAPRRLRGRLGSGVAAALAGACMVWLFPAFPAVSGIGFVPLLSQWLPRLTLSPVSGTAAFLAAAACGVAAAWVGAVVSPRRTAWGLTATACLLTLTQSMLLALHHTAWEPVPSIVAMIAGCLAASWRKCPVGAAAGFQGRVSPAMLEKLARCQDLSFLAADQRQGTVLTCRLLNEGTLREILPAPDFLKLCGNFRARAGEVLLRHNACLDPTESTGVRAFFGLPLASDTAGDEAVRAAMDLAAAFDSGPQLSEDTPPESIPVPLCGTGLATGTLTAGLTGNTYSVVGDAVEISRWLAALNSNHQTRILLDSATRLRADSAEDRPLEILNPPEGAAMEIFELLGTTGSLSADAMARRDAFRDAIVLLRAGHAGDALRRFADAGAGLAKPDPVLEHFLAQATHQVHRDGSSPPPAPLPLPANLLPPRRRLPAPRKHPHRP